MNTEAIPCVEFVTVGVSLEVAQSRIEDVLSNLSDPYCSAITSEYNVRTSLYQLK